jgi:hypothetical protein
LRITGILAPGSLVLGLVHVGSNSIADGDGEGGDLNQALHLPLLCLLVNLCQPAFSIFIKMILLVSVVGSGFIESVSEFSIQVNPDPDPRIQGFDDQKLRKKYSSKFLKYFLIKNCNLLFPMPP